MTELQVIGLGAWGPGFATWQGLVDSLAAGAWQAEVPLQPAEMPPRERRRAPQLVKMAVEVMSQACRMAGLRPDSAAIVYSSAMGDMQITDYMCRALSQTPRLISPTRFHHSVHNAAPGYWSIVTGATTPSNAIAAFEYTASMALLEGAIQAAEENIPVLVVTQEITAPLTLMDICPSTHPFSAAFLLAPPGFSEQPVCALHFSVSAVPGEWPDLPAGLHDHFGENMSAQVLSLLVSIAVLRGNNSKRRLKFPISHSSSLNVMLEASGVGPAARGA